MFITDEQFWWLIWNAAWLFSILLSAIFLLFPKICKKTNPIAWILGANAIAGMVWFGQHPLAAAREALFKRADPGYASAALPFDGRSIFIRNPRMMRLAVYDCDTTYSAGLCEMPVAHMLVFNDLDFIEMDLEDRLVRYSLSIHNPRCVEWPDDIPRDFKEIPFLLQDRTISPGLGACIIEDEIETITATHEITTTPHTMGWPSQQGYIAVTLSLRDTGKIIDRLDGWSGAQPYLRFDPPQGQPRRSTATLGNLLMIPASGTIYDRTLDDLWLAQYGIDEDILLTAMSSPYQAMRAETLWMACRDSVVNNLSPETLVELTAQSVSVFSTDWTYPQDCLDWMR